MDINRFDEQLQDIKTLMDSYIADGNDLSPIAESIQELCELVEDAVEDMNAEIHHIKWNFYMD